MNRAYKLIIYKKKKESFIMKKRIAILLLAVMALTLTLSACGTSMDSGDARFVGSWDFNGSMFYRFNEDGSGTMLGSAIRWTTSGNNLQICLTPSSCGDRCPAPLSSPFRFSNSDNTLNFNGFTYTRR